MSEHEIVIRGGLVVDGTGVAGRTADVGIDAGLITAVGQGLAGRRVVDADGAVVAPGWVDVHTHFDGQVTWDDTLDPSASNGVTTLVMGNCGVGFAPCPRGQEATLIELMEGVEDIPGTALYEGVPWGEWETFPEYLDVLGRRRYALDVGAQLAHGALRFHIMGERGVANEDATAEDLSTMTRLVTEAIEAGALGVSTSRTIFHRSLDGSAVPGTYATADELHALAAGMADGGGGVFEAITSSSIGDLEALGGERFDQRHELELLADIARRSGQPITFTTVQNADRPEDWRAVLRFVADQRAQGVPLYPQVASRAIGLLSSLRGYHPFMRRRTYLGLAERSVAERAAAMRDPSVRAAILADDDVVPEAPGSMESLYEGLLRAAPIMYALDSVVDYEPTAESMMLSIAAARGVGPVEALYDFLVEGEGTNVASLMGAGYVHGDLEAVREMLVDPHTVTGLADAGAHVKLICDGSMPTTQITHWARDRSRGERIALEVLVEKQTRRNAHLYGLVDRGTIEVGMRADVNVIDLDGLSVRRAEAVEDLPAGGWRFHQPVSGYLATFVAGVQTRDHDIDTGERPGRLVRNGGPNGGRTGR